jgi:hypothetical protein
MVGMSCCSSIGPPQIFTPPALLRATREHRGHREEEEGVEGLF